MGAGFKSRGNWFEDNLYSIQVYANDVNESNLVNDRPMIYWVNATDKAVPPNAGWVTLVGCNNITVEALNLDFKGSALILYQTNGCLFRQNHLVGCAEGIYVGGASQNEILNNLVNATGEYDVRLEYANNNTIRSNLISGSKVGIDISVASANNVTNNRIVNNTETAITIKYTGIGNFRGSLGPNSISQNIISGNGMGIFIDDGTDKIITYNNITENLGWAIQLKDHQQYNVIHHNNFIKNNVTGELQVSIGGYYLVSYPGWTPDSEYAIQAYLIASRTNFWDDDAEGNYWRDYEVLHPNA